MTILLSTLEQSLLLLPLVLGIYLSYAIIKATDLTVDGSFVLGAAVFARITSESIAGPLVATFIAMVAGSLAGVCVSFIQRKDRIDSLIAGILMLFMLYSINFQVLGKPNIGLYEYETLSDLISSPVLAIIVALIITGFVFVLLRSRLGVLLRAFGDNRNLLGSLGKSIEGYRMFGLGISNALAALCGAITSQVNGYADVNMGFGMALTGIGAVIIGSHLVKRLGPCKKFVPLCEIAGCFIGVFIYFLSVNSFLVMGIDPINLKLVLGLILVMFLRAAATKKHGGAHA